jgi:aminoglycoside phosphotransferase family enzyme
MTRASNASSFLERYTSSEKQIQVLTLLAFFFSSRCMVCQGPLYLGQLEYLCMDIKLHENFFQEIKSS